MPIFAAAAADLPDTVKWLVELGPFGLLIGFMMIGGRVKFGKNGTVPEMASEVHDTHERIKDLETASRTDGERFAHLSEQVEESVRETRRNREKIGQVYDRLGDQDKRLAVVETKVDHLGKEAA